MTNPMPLETLRSESHRQERAPRHLLSNIHRLNELYSELDQIISSVQRPCPHKP